MSRSVRVNAAILAAFFMVFGFVFWARVLREPAPIRTVRSTFVTEDAGTFTDSKGGKHQLILIKAPVSVVQSALDRYKLGSGSEQSMGVIGTTQQSTWYGKTFGESWCVYTGKATTSSVGGKQEIWPGPEQDWSTFVYYPPDKGLPLIEQLRRLFL